jgi:hypothetical protein
MEAEALRLQVNDYTTRWQFKLHVSIAAPDDSLLSGVDASILRLDNPEGHYVELLPRQTSVFPRRFKAANARLQFRAIEDSATPGQGNLPSGFFEGDGPYRYTLTLLGQQYHGEFSFGDMPQMHALQPEGGTLAPVRNFCMRSELPLQIVTVPRAFGPVYYKRQDLKNFVYQLANIDDSLSGGSYHPPVESPRFIFQVRVGDAGGTMQLLDPSRYIRGHKPHLIRSDWTETPIELNPTDLEGNKAVLIDFIRTDTATPNSGFRGPDAREMGWSGQLEIQQRVLYALYIDEPPSAGELMLQTGRAVVEEEQEDKPKSQGWRK